jgi:hypothetical protein
MQDESDGLIYVFDQFRIITDKETTAIQRNMARRNILDLLDMEFTAEMVKELRKETGAGLIDCKMALHDANADMDEAKTRLMSPQNWRW